MGIGLGILASGLLQAGGSIIGGSLGGEGEMEIPWQTKDYYEFAKMQQIATRTYVLNALARKKYEGFPGARDMRTMATGMARSMMDQPPPDYFGRATKQHGGILEEGVSGAAASLEEGGAYAPYAGVELKEGDEGYTEWDKIASEQGIFISKYDHFESANALQQTLWDKNWSETEVGPAESVIGQYILAQLFPELKHLGTDVFNGIARSIKTWIKTAKDMGNDFVPFGGLFQ